MNVWILNWFIDWVKITFLNKLFGNKIIFCDSGIEICWAVSFVVLFVRLNDIFIFKESESCLAFIVIGRMYLIFLS